MAEALSARVDAVVDNSIVTPKEERNKQVTCLALAVYYESRGESLAGQKAVASVVMNRVYSPKYPDTACDVVFQPYQFSFVKGSRLNPTDARSWNRSVAIADEYIDRKSFDLPYLSFTAGRGRGHRIGSHFFY